MRSKVKTLLICFVLLTAIRAAAQDKKYTADEYIRRYKNLAISEMRRTGIPASITLAQGLLESGTGNSKLARDARNHFGIKCKKDGDGVGYHMDDDAPNECFRVYDKPEDSYKDHSDFIITGKRYSSLFDLDPKDYKGWANGLKSAGYATNPNYPQLLITSIEQYKLYELDETREVAVARIDSTHFQYNGLPAYIVKPDETIDNVAKKNNLSATQLRKNNDLSDSDIVSAGTILYLKPKTRNGTQEFYTIQDGDDMYYVSQAFRIRLKQLYRKNRMPEGAEPAPGQKIYLQSKRDGTPAIITTTANEKKRGIIALPLKPKVSSDLVKKENPGNNDSLERSFGQNHSKPNLPQVDTGLATRIDTTLKGLQRRLNQRNEARRTNYDSLAKASLAALAKAHEDSVRQKASEASVNTGDQTIPPSRDSLKLSNVQDSNGNKPPPLARESTERAQVNDSGSNKYHTVIQGETLYSICKKCRIPVDSLKKWNNISGSTISTGMKLSIISYDPITHLDNSGNENTISQYHIVTKGESLYAIAKKYSLTLDTLKSMNGIVDNSLKPGQKLRIK